MSERGDSLELIEHAVEHTRSAAQDVADIMGDPDGSTEDLRDAVTVLLSELGVEVVYRDEEEER